MSATLFILLVTLCVSLYGFSRQELVGRLLFDVDAIRFRREYHRFLSSSLVHADAMHLLFNLWVIYQFGDVLEQAFFGGINTTLLYLLCVAGGNGLCWLKHRHGSYRGLGASGGALGLIFSLILLAPTAFSIWFIPAWLFGALYLGYSVWSAHRGQDNIGHIAHLGGAFTGFAITALFVKGAVMQQSTLFVGLLALFGAGWWILFKGPLSLKQEHTFRKAARKQKRAAKDQDQLDRLLEKVAREGIHSLSKGERAVLDRESQRRRSGGR